MTGNLYALVNSNWPITVLASLEKIHELTTTEFSMPALIIWHALKIKRAILIIRWSDNAQFRTSVISVLIIYITNFLRLAMDILQFWCNCAIHLASVIFHPRVYNSNWLDSKQGQFEYKSNTGASHLIPKSKTKWISCKLGKFWIKHEV